jgi:hypothetical protein
MIRAAVKRDFSLGCFYTKTYLPQNQFKQISKRLPIGLLRLGVCWRGEGGGVRFADTASKNAGHTQP